MRSAVYTNQWSLHKTIMRKYWRLTLIGLTCLAFVLMFAYRQKYSKLTLVFELMNAFQNHDSEAKCKQEMFDFKKTLKTDFSIQERIAGVPYWTEIFPGIYSYSTYWFSKMTRSLLFTKNLTQASLTKIQCKLHYDDGEHVGAPKTNVYFVEKNVSKNVIFVECLPYNTKVPHSISFVYNNVSSSTLPVISQDSYYGQYTMCVKPLPPAFVNVYELLEFIIYHSHIGVKFFIFYENGLSIKAKTLLMETAVKDGIHILLLPWTLPLDFQAGFNNSELFLVDCLQRVVARNHSEFIFKLGINDFIVPQSNWDIKHLRKELTFPVAKFQEKRFCAEFKSDVIAQNLNMHFVTLLKTQFLNENLSITAGYDIVKLKMSVTNSSDFRTWLFKKKSQRSDLIPEASAVIQSYSKCGIKNDMHSTEDKNMWMYKDTFFKSHLYLLAKESNLIIS